MPIPHHLLTPLLQSLREEGSYVLSSPEDADYFRQAEMKKGGGKTSPSSVLKPNREPPPPAPPSPSFVPPEAKRDLPPSYSQRTQEKRAEPHLRPTQSETPKSSSNPVPSPSQEVLEKPKEPFLFSSIRNIVSVAIPELSILTEIPNDSIARKISERWKTKNQSAPISILTFQEPEEQRMLLEQIGKAVDVYFGPAKIIQAEEIEKEAQWEAFLSVKELKAIIVCDYTLWQLRELMKFYKETPAQGIRVLGNTPVFLLPDLSLYIQKDPLLKRSLWRALCQKLS